MENNQSKKANKSFESKLKNDSRFASISSDPKFMTAPKEVKKVKVDKRFNKMLTDKSFVSTAQRDKFGIYFAINYSSHFDNYRENIWLRRERWES